MGALAYAGISRDQIGKSFEAPSGNAFMEPNKSCLKLSGSDSDRSDSQNMTLDLLSYCIPSLEGSTPCCRHSCHHYHYIDLKNGRHEKRTSWAEHG